MKIHIFFALIITGITTLQTHAMDDQMILLHAQNYVMRDAGSPFSSHCKKQYDPQIFTDDIWDRVIAQISPQDRANLKETCGQLSILTSVNRLNKFVIHDFDIGNWNDKAVLFKAIITTSNPELITTIMCYAHKETSSWHYSEPDSVCIDVEPYTLAKKEYIQKYATRLMQEALKQENETMIEALEKEDYDSDMIDSTKGAIKYRKKLKADDTRCNCVIGWSVTGLCGVMCFVIYATSHAAQYGNYTYSPITMPPFNFH